MVNGLGEECDGGDFSVSCEDEGFYAVAMDEELACDSSCKLDTDVCEGKCGDGIVNGPETCDDQEIATTCFQEGYDRGYVTCEESCTPNLADCGEIGWKHIRMPSAGDLNDAWIDSTNQMAYAVGQGFFQFDGTAWVLLANPGEELDSLSGVSEKEIYAVGSSDGVWRFDGENWKTLKEPTSSLQYNAVWASGHNDVWIVGDDGTIVRYKDSEFVTQDVSVPGSVELNDIWGTGNDNIYVVGDKGLVLHFDGSVWREISTSAMTENLLAISVNMVGEGSPIEFWVSGEGGSILRWNGAAFEDEDADDVLENHDVTVRSVYRFGEDLFAVGGGRRIWNKRGTWHRHRKGNGNTSWNRFFQLTPDGPLFAAARNSPTVPGGGFRYTGSTMADWIDDPDDDDAPPAPPEHGTVFERFTGGAAWTSSNDDVYAIHHEDEDNNQAEPPYYGINYYDGDEWRELPFPTLDPLDFPTSIWAEELDNVIVITNLGALFRYTAGAWEQEPSEQESSEQESSEQEPSESRVLRAVWGHKESTFAVGNDGLVFDGTGYENIADSDLHAVWGTSPSNVYSVGAGGHIFSFDGTEWKPMASPTDENLNAVWGTSASDVYAAGENSTVLHYDGSTWTIVLLADQIPATSLHAIGGTSPKDIFIVGGEGVTEGLILHYDGTAWGSVFGPLSNFTGVSAGRHGVFLFGEATRRLLRSKPW